MNSTTTTSSVNEMTTAAVPFVNNTCGVDEKYNGQLTGSLSMSSLFILFLIVGTFYLVKYYSDRQVHTSYLIIITIAWVSGFLGAVFLPLDIALTSAEGNFLCCGETDDTKCAWNWEDDVETCWTTLYWFTFSLTWLVLPVVMEVYNAAEFSFGAKLKYSIMSQIKFYAMAGVLGIVLMIIFFAQDPDEQAQQKLVASAMSLGNAYGLFMVVFLLGDGLVRVPRQIWRSADSRTEEARTSAKAGDAHIKLVGAEQAAKLKAVLKKIIDADLQIKYDKSEAKWGPYISEIMEPIMRLKEGQTHAEIYAEAQRPTSKKVWIELKRTKRSGEHFWTNLDSDDEKLKKLVELHRQAKTQIKYVFRRRGKWIDLVRDFRFYKRLNDHSDGKVTDDEESFRPVFRDEPLLYILYWVFCICLCCCPSMRAAVLALRRYVLRTVAVILFALSLIVVAAEVTVPATGQQSLVGFVVKENSDVETGVFLWTLIFFGYMSVCTYSSFMSLSLPIPGTDVNSRNIVSNHLSSPYALMLFGTYLCRMQFALGYHFLNIMQYEGEPQNLQPSAFKRLYLANGDVSGLGIDWFFAVFPIGVFVMFVLVLSHAYSYCLVSAGMGNPEDTVNVEGLSKSTTVLAGRNLLRSEMAHLKQKELQVQQSCCSCIFGSSTTRILIPEGSDKGDVESGTASKTSNNATTIKIGALKHRDSWGSDDLGTTISTKTATVTIGAPSDEDDDMSRSQRRKVATIAANTSTDGESRMKRFKVGSLRVRKSDGGRFFGPKFVEHWVELDTKKRELQWYEGDDSSGKHAGTVYLNPGTDVSVRKVDKSEVGCNFAFELKDGPLKVIFAATSDEERYGWTHIARRCLGMRSLSVSKMTASPAYKHSKTAILFREERGFFGTRGSPCFVQLNSKRNTLKWFEGRNESGKEIGSIGDLAEYRTRSYVGTVSKMKFGFELVPARDTDRGLGRTIRFAAPNEMQQKDWIEALTSITGSVASPATESKREIEMRPKAPTGGSIDKMTSALDGDDDDNDESDFLSAATRTAAAVAAAQTTSPPRNKLTDALDDAEDNRDEESDLLDDW